MKIFKKVHEKNKVATNTEKLGKDITLPVF